MLSLVDLDQVNIEASSVPTTTWGRNGRTWEKYNIRAHLGGVYVANIDIERALNPNGKGNDIIFFDSRGVPIPIVSYQETREEFRGNGIIGRVIVLANEFYREMFEKSLHSSTYSSPTARQAPRRVWKKLEDRGLARYVPCESRGPAKSFDRWALV